jgi:hypothetical protein
MKPKTFVMTLAAVAVITGAGAGFASADAADQGANDSSYSSQHGRDPGAAAREDRDESTTERGYDSRWFSPSGYGHNDEQADATRALNNEQLASGGRDDNEDVQGPSDDDNDADENDDSRDKAPSPGRD